MGTAEMAVGVFPGQGAYAPDALKTLLTEDGGRELVERIDSVAGRMLGRGVLDTLDASGYPRPEELLSSAPDLFQVAAFATSVGLHEVLRRRGIELDLLTGHSLGEVSALVGAGALGVAEGTELLCHRIIALRELDTSGGRMIAVSCDRERMTRILDLLSDARVVVAVDNGPHQTTVSGDPDAIARIERIAAAIDVKATRLPAPHPFHNPVLDAARTEFGRRVDGLRLGGPHPPVYSPILGRYYRAGEDCGEVLANHLVLPADFGSAVRRLHRDGASIWVEMGAGRAISGLARSIVPAIKALTPLASGYGSIQATAEFLRGAVPDAGGPARDEDAPAAPPLTPPAESTPPAECTPPGSAHLDRAQVADRIRRLYADVLEYPEDVFEESAELEADLGVDSVKQTELFARVAESFGMGVPPDGLRIADFQTFGSVVDLVHAWADREVAA